MFSDISGYTVQLGTAYMPDINKEASFSCRRVGRCTITEGCFKSTKLSGKGLYHR